MEEIKNKQKHNIHMLEEIDVDTILQKRKNKRLLQRKLKRPQDSQWKMDLVMLRWNDMKRSEVVITSNKLANGGVSDQVSTRSLILKVLFC